jgi:putative peptidoglycan lipid II flippase
MTMMRGVFTVGFWTLVSRVMGFLRDVLIAGAFGGLSGGRGFFSGLFFAQSVPEIFRRRGV